MASPPSPGSRRLAPTPLPGSAQKGTAAREGRRGRRRSHCGRLPCTTTEGPGPPRTCRPPAAGPGTAGALAIDQEPAPLARLPVQVTDLHAAQLGGPHAGEVGELAHHTVAE